MKYKVGDSFRAKIPFNPYKPMRIHITHIIPSSVYSDVTLIIYKVYGKHRQWWHEFMCKGIEMDHYIAMYNLTKNKVVE